MNSLTTQATRATATCTIALTLVIKSALCDVHQYTKAIRVVRFGQVRANLRKAQTARSGWRANSYSKVTGFIFASRQQSSIVSTERIRDCAFEKSIWFEMSIILIRKIQEIKSKVYRMLLAVHKRQEERSTYYPRSISRQEQDAMR